LKRSGEEDWKKKISVQKKTDFEGLVGNNQKKDQEKEIAENNKNAERNGECDEIPTLRRGRGNSNRIATTLEGAARPVSLFERLNQVKIHRLG
jgi:hypothetical protein